METKIAIVIPNWNGLDFLGDCLDSLKSQKQKSTVIVVDNGSTDGSLELVLEKYKWVELVKLDKNYGFAGGVNRGLQHAKSLGAELVAVFNNDAVADKNWLSELASTADSQPSSGIITGKFMLLNGKHIDSTGDFYTIWGVPYPRGRNQKDRGQYDRAGHVFGGSGGASLYRMSMLDKIGLFDEDFFAYYEDVDLSFRAQASGWRVYYQPLAIAYHRVGATSSKLGSFTRYHSIKNTILLYNRNMPGRLFWKYKPLLTLTLVRMLVGCLRDRQLVTFFKGFFVAVYLFPATLRVRKRNKKIRKISVDEIDRLLVHSRPPKIPKI